LAPLVASKVRYGVEPTRGRRDRPLGRSGDWGVLFQLYALRLAKTRRVVIGSRARSSSAKPC